MDVRVLELGGPSCYVNLERVNFIEDGPDGAVFWFSDTLKLRTSESYEDIIRQSEADHG